MTRARGTVACKQRKRRCVSGSALTQSLLAHICATVYHMAPKHVQIRACGFTYEAICTLVYAAINLFVTQQ